MIQKPGKSAELAKSYRSIKLLPVLSKLFEKLLLSKISIIMKGQGLILDHQFSFRDRHVTIEQMHRIVKRINNEMDTSRYCTATFLNVSQAFDKVWYQGLLHEIKNSFPIDFYAIIRSYLLHRTFRVKYGEVVTKEINSQLKEISSRIPQGSVLGPVLYLLYTTDLSLALGSTTTSYADDTAVLVAHNNNLEASLRLEESLHHIQNWLKNGESKLTE
ncbi:hypothetical protein HN011_009142 [Eciton burchellii]|nr:hypothetical protein HN011_000765 [Eciton burchellii]KAH0944426.1 hypothetical protein HN011_009141 [Eciton burchellii]KAH0944427.1 hypothetical protein HN011_009142 [Eciton burchellii]